MEGRGGEKGGVTYSGGGSPLCESRFEELMSGGLGMFGCALAALFVALEVGDGEVGFSGGVEGEEGEDWGEEVGDDGGHCGWSRWVSGGGF